MRCLVVEIMAKALPAALETTTDSRSGQTMVAGLYGGIRLRNIGTAYRGERSIGSTQHQTWIYSLWPTLSSPGTRTTFRGLRIGWRRFRYVRTQAAIRDSSVNIKRVAPANEPQTQFVWHVLSYGRGQRELLGVKSPSLYTAHRELF